MVSFFIRFCFHFSRLPYISRHTRFFVTLQTRLILASFAVNGSKISTPMPTSSRCRFFHEDSAASLHSHGSFSVFQNPFILCIPRPILSLGAYKIASATVLGLIFPSEFVPLINSYMTLSKVLHKWVLGVERIDAIWLTLLKRNVLATAILPVNVIFLNTHLLATFLISSRAYV